MPLFGHLENIWLANEEALLEYFTSKTEEFHSNLAAYKVEKPCAVVSTKFRLHSKMLDFNNYSLVKINSGNKLISI